MSSEFSHWYLDATVHRDQVEEVYYVSDPAQNIRRKRQTRVWKVEQLLGHGSFGQVRLERNQENGQARAVKRITTTSAILSNSECEKELKALLEFSKPKFKEAAVFVEFYGWFRDGYDIFLAMEYAHLGDLHKNVVANSGKIPEIEARDIAEQILFGLQIMHAERFAHRDLKPQNVLVIHGPPKWWVKLADFGLSKRLTDSMGYKTAGVGSLSYMAPEIIDSLDSHGPGPDYTNAIDIWSAGCIVYRLITGLVPFPRHSSLIEFCKDKSLFPYDALFDSGIKSEGSKFLRHLLVANPNARPSATEALNHNWILSGSIIERIPHKEESSELHLEENLRCSTSSSSKIDYNTASHAGLHSEPLLPSSSLQTILPPQSVAEIPNLPDNTIVAPYPIRPTSVFEHGSDLQDASKSEQPHLATRIKKRRSASFDQETRPIVEVRTSKAVNNLSNISSTRNPSEGKENTNFFRKLKTKFLNNQVVSPDSKLVASSSSYGTKQRHHTFTGHRREVDSVAFSPDGQLVASVSWDKTVRLWDTASGAVQRTLTGHSNFVRSVAFSPDGQLVASGSWDNTVRLWDTASGAVQRTLTGHSLFVQSVAFSPDGQLVASGSWDNTVRLWDTASGAVQRTLTGHSHSVLSVAFSPDGQLVASGSWDKTVRLWDTASGAVQGTLTGHTHSVWSVAFSPDGQLVASGSGDKTVRLWEI